MGFPVAYSELLLRTIILLVYLRSFISTLFLYLGPDIPRRDTADADVSDSSSPATRHRDIPLWAVLFKELLRPSLSSPN
ncbi:hypothetical protein GQ457_06G037960 [Hibiscus cannabinus]